MTLQLTKKHSFDLVFDSQNVYRLILEAMSNPGKIVPIGDCTEKLYGDFPAFLAVAMTLLDSEVSFHVCENKSLSEEIISLVHARSERIETADFIFVCDLHNMKFAVENAKHGTLSDPHKSAIVIVQNESAPSLRVTLSGPGIEGQTVLLSTPTVKEAIMIRDTLNHEYPQGIDFLFISRTGDLFAIPRSVKVME